MVACNQFAAFLLVGEMGSELVRLSHNSQRERRTLSLSLTLEDQCVLTANLGN